MTATVETETGTPTPTPTTRGARRLPLADTTRAELRRLLRWPATWVLGAVWIVLNILFTYVFDWISYRTGETTGPAEPQSESTDVSAVSRVSLRMWMGARSSTRRWPCATAPSCSSSGPGS